MGFDLLQDGSVTVDHTHNKFGDTRISHNPTCATTKCNLRVYSIFKRFGHKGNKQQSRGDNCPMIYALKGLDGLHTSFSSIKRLNQSFTPILDKFVAQVGAYELLVPMPSSSPIGFIVARRTMRRMPEAKLIQLLSKITVAQAREQIQRQKIPYSDRSTLTNTIKRISRETGDDTPLSLKTIPVKQRRYLNPIALTADHPTLPTRILLVDDLLSTGTTLKAARNILQERFPAAQIDALCLFSSVGGRIKN